MDLSTPQFPIWVRTLAVAAVLMTGLSACGKGDSSNTQNSCTPASDVQKDDVVEDTVAGPALRALAQRDIQHLSDFHQSGAADFDNNNRQIFTKIFGGTSGADLLRYLNQRIRYYITPDQNAEISPGTFQYTGWVSDANSCQTVSSGNRVSDIAQVLADSKPKGILIASNQGMQLWLDSLVNQVAVTLYLEDQAIPIESPQSGVVMLDQGYTDSITLHDGRIVSTPVFYRQSVLIHEARHSDCTGGITEADLQHARDSHSAQEFDKDNNARACGHLHSFCPKGHDLEGLPACDEEAWGAYNIEKTFIEAVGYGKNLNADDWEVASMIYADTKSRVLVQVTGDPDMTSSGYRQN